MQNLTEASTFTGTVPVIEDQVDEFEEAALVPTAQSLANRTRFLYDALSALGMKQPCIVATTASISLAGLQTIDGILLVAGNSVLVKSQANAYENGIYVAAAGAWSRRYDCDSTADANMATVAVSSGLTNAATIWTQITALPTVGSSNLVFVKVYPHPFTTLANKPTTVSGYGITDMYLYAPPGAVTAFAGSVAPQGWLESNGVIVPNGNGTVQGVTADFSALFAVLGSTYGAAGQTPDLRGEFIRGWDHSKGTDIGRVLGSAQADAIKAHTHAVAEYAGVGGNLKVNTSTSPVEGGPVSGSTGGTETRPRNIALMYIIKY